MRASPSPWAISEAADAQTSKFGKHLTEGHARDYKRQPGSKMRLPDLLVAMRRMGDEIDAGLNAPDYAGERAALSGTTIAHAGRNAQYSHRLTALRWATSWPVH
jgi:hypothetical protein